MYSPAIGVHSLAFLLLVLAMTILALLNPFDGAKSAQLADGAQRPGNTSSAMRSKCQFRVKRETTGEKRDGEWESQLVGEGVKARAYVMCLTRGEKEARGRQMERRRRISR